jgi:hypothetical protein
MKNEHIQTKNNAGSIIVIILSISLGYAVLRYHIMGNVPWKDLPFFIMNKGLALSAIILLTLNFSLGPLHILIAKIPDGWLNARKTIGMTGFLLVLLHVIMSSISFNPTIYGKFFEPDGSMTLLAGLSMLGGVLSFVVLWGYNLSFQTQLRKDKAFIQLITSRKFLLTAMLLTAAHLFFMGYKGWLDPSGWLGGMPPISLIGFVIFVFGYIINLVGRK